MNEYENVRRISYGTTDYENAVFIPVCEKCGRFVKSDPSIKIRQDGLTEDSNATCSKCGRTKMIFEGFF